MLLRFYGDRRLDYIGSVLVTVRLGNGYLAYPPNSDLRGPALLRNAAFAAIISETNYSVS